MRDRGATILEAALAVPLILVLVFSLVEFGRYITISATVTNASREAARYASGTGPGTGPDPRYGDCDGMRDAAQKFAVLGEPADSDITLEYDSGPGTPVFLTCSGSSVDPATIEDGDRIIATVSVAYDPIIPVIGKFLGPTTLSVQTIRSIHKAGP